MKQNAKQKCVVIRVGKQLKQTGKPSREAEGIYHFSILISVLASCNAFKHVRNSLGCYRHRRICIPLDYNNALLQKVELWYPNKRSLTIKAIRQAMILLKSQAYLSSKVAPYITVTSTDTKNYFYFLKCSILRGWKYSICTCVCVCL